MSIDVAEGIIHLSQNIWGITQSSIETHIGTIIIETPSFQLTDFGNHNAYFICWCKNYVALTFTTIQLCYLQEAGW